METKLKALLNRDWLGIAPDVLIAAEAFRRQTEGLLCVIHWWGDLPAGFTRFVFDIDQPGGRAYTITVLDESDRASDIIEADEYVLLFPR